MKKYFFSLALVIPLCVFSQNYKVVSNILPAFYSSELDGNNTGTQAFAIESQSIVGTDIMYSTFKTMRSDPEELDWGACVDSSGGAVMGKKLVQQNNRTILFNQNGDSIFVYQKTSIGNSWNYFKYNNGHFIEAIHNQTNYIDILGTFDSVKVFVLMHNDIEGNVVEDEINGAEIHLSKNFGLIKTFDNYMFPFQLIECSLIGYENAEVGVKNLNAQGVYDYQIGDEFHFYRENLHWYFDDTDTLYKIDYGQERWAIRYVTHSTNYQDSVTYEYVECSRIYEYSNDKYDTLYLTETVTETIIFNSVLPGILDAYTNQKIENVEFGGGLYYEILQNQTPMYNFRPKKMIVDDAYMNNDSCVGRSIFDPCCYSESYIAGCGGPYYYWSDWFGTTIERKLLYFNKNGEIWGEPLAQDCQDLLSNVDERPRLINSISVYPNPFTGQLNIKSEDNRSRIKEVELMESNYTMRTKHLSNGIYILEIKMENGNVVRKKVIKN